MVLLTAVNTKGTKFHQYLEAPDTRLLHGCRRVGILRQRERSGHREQIQPRAGVHVCNPLVSRHLQLGALV